MFALARSRSAPKVWVSDQTVYKCHVKDAYVMRLGTCIVPLLSLTASVTD